MTFPHIIITIISQNENDGDCSKCEDENRTLWNQECGKITKNKRGLITYKKYKVFL